MIWNHSYNTQYGYIITYRIILQQYCQYCYYCNSYIYRFHHHYRYIYHCNPTFEGDAGVVDEDVHSSIVAFKVGSSGSDAVHVVDVQLVKLGRQSLWSQSCHRLFTPAPARRLEFTFTLFFPWTSDRQIGRQIALQARKPDPFLSQSAYQSSQSILPRVQFHQHICLFKYRELAAGSADQYKFIFGSGDFTICAFSLT